MNETAQQIVVAAAVVGSIVYLVVRARKKTGCGGGCGTSCAAKNLGATGDDAHREKTPMGS
jgi:hypothetical protein